jgi:hypothetical protein
MDHIPNEIKNLYQQLENITTLDRWNLTDQITPLDEVFSHEWNQKLAAEQLCLRFALNGGKLKSSFVSITKDGKEVGYPSINDFSDEAVVYIKKRTAEAKNPVLLCRYNHLLYEIQKHRDFAIKAINAYKQLIYLKLENDFQDRLLPSVQAILRLTENTKYQINETKEELIKLTLNENISIHNKYNVINEFINSTIFKLHELKFFPELGLTWLSLLNDEDYYLKKGILESALKVSTPNGLSTNLLYEKLAENEEFILQQHLDDSDFIKPQILGRIMEYYKNAKNIVKYEEFEKEYTRVKSLTELSLIQIPIEDEINRQLNEEINKNLKTILTWEPDQIFAYFSIHSELFPDIDSIIARSTKNYNESFLRFATSCVFDINGNVKKLTDEEGLELEKYRNYQLALGISVLPVLIRVMQTCVFNFKISYLQLYSYLFHNSWYGQKLPKMKLRSKGEDDSYNWLDLMAPALHHFFMQVEASFLLGSENPFSNYVLAIDSLTLKFEGALRDFVRLVGGSSSKFNKDDIKEMLLENLLNSDTVKKEFNDNDIALFKMVFTSKGDNIRNNVAHCFYQAGDYRLEMICKIFLCILRLGKYKLKPASENE